MVAQLLGPDGAPIRPVEYDDGFALPHTYSFAAMLGGIRTYWHDKWDEAYRHSRADALTMRRDCWLMALLQERMKAVSSLNWHLAVPDEKDPLQMAVRDELTKIVKGVRGLRRIIKSLLWAIWYGRYAVQLVWGWKIQDGRRVLTVTKWQPVNGDKIGHTYDGTPYILVNASQSQNLPKADLITTTYNRALKLSGTWRDRFVFHVHEIDDADYMDAEMGERIHGVGIRDGLFWLNWIRLEWLSKLSDYIERVGLGVNLWYYEEGNKQSFAEVQAAARDFSDRVNLFIPRSQMGKAYGAGLERIEPGTAGADVLVRLMQWLEEKMERYVVGQTLSSKSEGSGMGGTGVADLHAATKHKIAASDASDLAESLTGSDEEPGLISMIHRWTFPETYPSPGNPNGFPVWFVFDVEGAESGEKLDAMKKAYDMGVSIKADEVRAGAGLSKPDEGDEVVEQQQPEPGMPGMPGSGPPGQGPPKKPGKAVASAAGDGPPQRRFARWGFDKGRWVTIGAKPGAEGKGKSGGSPVYVEDGKITKGSPNITGKSVGDMKGTKNEAVGGHRKQLNDGKEYARALWKKKARQAGLDPQALHQLVAERVQQSKAFVQEQKAMLKEARRLSVGLGYGDLRTLAARNAAGKKDASNVKGLDDIAARLEGTYADHFAGSDPADKLYEMLVQPDPVPIDEEEAMEWAYGQLEEHKADHEAMAEQEQGREDVVPFVRDANGQEHDPDGKFGSGGGGKTPKAFNEQGERISNGHYTNMHKLAGEMHKGNYDPHDVLEDLEKYASDALGANARNINRKYKEWKDEAVKHFGAESVNTPEWKELAGVFRAVRDETDGIIEDMANVVEVEASLAARAGRSFVSADTQDSLADYSAALKDSYDAATRKIADAADKFLESQPKRYARDGDMAAFIRDLAAKLDFESWYADGEAPEGAKLVRKTAKGGYYAPAGKQSGGGGEPRPDRSPSQTTDEERASSAEKAKVWKGRVSEIKKGDIDGQLDMVKQIANTTGLVKADRTELQMHCFSRGLLESHEVKGGTANLYDDEGRATIRGKDECVHSDTKDARQAKASFNDSGAAKTIAKTNGLSSGCVPINIVMAFDNSNGRGGLFIAPGIVGTGGRMTHDVPRKLKAKDPDGRLAAALMPVEIATTEIVEKIGSGTIKPDEWRAALKRGKAMIGDIDKDAVMEASSILGDSTMKETAEEMAKSEAGIEAMKKAIAEYEAKAKK